MNNQNMNSKGMDAMLRVVSGKLGMSPEDLRTQIQSGKLDGAMQGMSQQDSQKLMNALSNPVMAQKILATPQAQEIIKKLQK